MIALSACATHPDCTQMEVPGIVARVIDAESDASLAVGASGTAHADLLTRSFSAFGFDSAVQPVSLAAYVPAGTYRVLMSHANYQTWDSTVTVRRGEGCSYVIPVELTIGLRKI